MFSSTLPDLPSRLLHEALAALGGGSDRLVLGPAADGGFYLAGMSRLRPAIFERIDWGTGKVFAQTLDAACAANLDVVLLDEWADVDEAADLERIVQHRTDRLVAPRTRAWAAEHLAGAG